MNNFYENTSIKFQNSAIHDKIQGYLDLQKILAFSKNFLANFYHFDTCHNWSNIDE